MKKMFIFLVMIVALLMCFVSCDFGKNNVDDKTEEKTEQHTVAPESKESIYDVLNELTQVNYKKVEMTVRTVTGDVDLTSNYILSDSSVTYFIERMNLLPTDGNIENLSSEYKSSLSGTAKIESGKVVEFDGQGVSLPSYEELKGCLNFQEMNFKNVREKTGSFSADVISATEFLGTDKAMTDMKLVVDYNSSSFRKITITYRTAKSTVTILYNFEK